MRKKVFHIFCGFLVVMLTFTILSRAVNGAAMAKVETTTISSGTITHKVTGSGKVEAGKEIAVFTESGQRIQEVCVQEGQAVEAGEVLFQLDMEELEEQLLTAQQELEKTKLQNQDAESEKNAEQQNRITAKNRAEEDYNEAVSQGNAAVEEARAKWEAAEQSLNDFLANNNPKTERNLQNPGAETGNTSGTGSETAANEEEGSTASGENGAVNGGEGTTAHGENGAANGGEETAAPIDNSTTGNSTTDYEMQKNTLEQAVNEAKAAYDAAVSNRNETIKNAVRALEDASAKAATDSTLQLNEITIQQQELALQKLQALKEAEGKVTAPVNGVVTKIAVTTGEFTTEGTAMMVADTSQGSRLVVSVDKTNEKYIAPGAAVKITSSSLKEDKNDYAVTSVAVNGEDKNLLDVTIDLPEGVLTVGALADIEVTQKSKNYSTVIPIEALHEEQGRYYVLIAEEQQGVLGTELVVKRLEVELLEKNDTKAALADGILTDQQEIISSSNKMIDEGSRVRK